jgi:Transcriptional regulator, AbiEi antitoxin
MPAVSALGRLRRLGPVFRSKDAVEAGVSWRDLYRLRDGGDILELSRGVYQLAGQPVAAMSTSSPPVRVLRRA